MANEDKKDFNAMLHEDKDMPRIQIITDRKSIEKYGGERMYFAPPVYYDEIMKCVPVGRLLTVGTIRDYLAKKSRGGLHRADYGGCVYLHSCLGQLPEDAGQDSLLENAEGQRGA